MKLRRYAFSDFPLKYKSKKIPKKYGICRSNIEYETFRRLDHNPDVKIFIPEPFAIPYEYKGEYHKYIPDLFILYKDSSQKIVEIKHIPEITLPKNKAKLTAAKKYCYSKKMNFEIWSRRIKGAHYRDDFLKPKNYSSWEEANEEYLKFASVIEAKQKWRKIFKTFFDIVKILFGLLLYGGIIYAIIKAIIKLLT